MLTELETRLAAWLGGTLAAPFGGRVRRRGAAAPNGNGPVIRLGVDAFEPLEPDVGSIRVEPVGGPGDRRRIVRLGVHLGLEVEPQNNGDRLQILLGTDALIYALDAPEARTGRALVQPGDQGFLLDSLRLAPIEDGATSQVRLRAEGWFWPVGVAGETGVPIARAVLRELELPALLTAAVPVIAGGPTVPFSLAIGATGAMDLRGPRQPAATLPFGALALRVLDEGGGPGAGVLTGDRAGPEGTVLVDVTGGALAFSYAPPSAAGNERLVIAAYTRDEGGGERVGMELARFDLAVTP